MSKRIATAFQSFNKILAYETRIKTLDLYRSLLRSARPYNSNQEIENEIRKRFKKNRFVTSRPKVLDLLKEANETLQKLNEGISNNVELKEKIEAYAKKHFVTNTKEKPVAREKKKKYTKRKPYQVAITTRTSAGFVFKRVRGWRQPVRTSMRLKRKVQTVQKRIDRIQTLKSYLEMVKEERLFLKQLNCLPDDNLRGYENTLKMGLSFNSNHKR